MKERINRNTVIRTVALTLLCVLLGIVAAMQYRTILATEDTRQSGANQIADLRETIIKLNSELDSVTLEKDALQEQLNRIEQSSHDELLKSLKTELENVKLFAGLTDVRGRGVYIQIATEGVNSYLLQGKLLELFNELRASGAQAISINGIRVVSMSEVRVVNSGYISVNAQQLVAPYDIYAIGDPKDLMSGIEMTGSGVVHTLNAIKGVNCIWRTEENIAISACDESMINTDWLETKQ